MLGGLVPVLLEQPFRLGLAASVPHVHSTLGVEPVAPAQAFDCTTYDASDE
jgi:hypothetical protein